MSAQENRLHLFGGDGQTLLFAHANGYPPAAYGQFLAPLARDFRVVSAPARPLWHPPHEPGELTDWSMLADDLLQALEQDRERDDNEPVVAVGHSLGAFITLLAAARRPELFRALVLIEPAFLSGRNRFLLQLFRRLGPYRIPLVARTLQRRDRWQSVEEVYAYYRPKPVFSRIPDPVLWEYVLHGTQPDDAGGRTLTFSKEWEAQIYLTIGNHEPLLRQSRDLPVLGIRGRESTTLRPEVWKRWRLLAPEHQFHEVRDQGHLLPLEAPELVAGLVRDFANSRT